jgi:prepilin-type processing-associated H-X9-DG protein
MLMEVTDAAAIGRTIDKFAAVAQADPTFLGAAASGKAGARIEVTTLGDLKITSIVFPSAPFVSPSVAVSNGFLIYAGNKETVKSTIDRLIAPGPSVVDSTDYARVRSALAKQAVQLGYVNLDRAIDFFYEVGVPEISRKIDAANLNGQTTLTSAAIPPAYVVKKDIDGIGVSVSASGNLIDAQVYSPFGLAVVIPAAIALPALASDLHPAAQRRVGPSVESTGAKAGPDAGRDRLVQIGAKLQLATIERKGRFPDRIEDAVPAEMLKAPQADEGGPGADYVYVPGLTMNSSGRSVLVYERKGLQSEGRHVLFVDGSVELLSEDDFAKLPGISAGK